LHAFGIEFSLDGNLTT